MKQIRILCVVLLFAVVYACEEPESCQKKDKKYCATHAKLRTKCPCTCAADINFLNCCANQEFEKEICRDLCTYNVGQSAKLFKEMGIICFNDGFKMQYCATNGYQNSTDCCLENGVTKDEPGKAGCSRFCEGNWPACSQMIDYLQCTRGTQLRKAVECAIYVYDKPRWKRNATVHVCT